MKVLICWSDTGTGDAAENVMEISEFTGAAIIAALRQIELDVVEEGEEVLPAEIEPANLTWLVTPNGQTAAFAYMTDDAYFGDIIFHGSAHLSFNRPELENMRGRS